MIIISSILSFLYYILSFISGKTSSYKHDAISLSCSDCFSIEKQDTIINIQSQIENDHYVININSDNDELYQDSPFQECLRELEFENPIESNKREYITTTITQSKFHGCISVIESLEFENLIESVIYKREYMTITQSKFHSYSGSTIPPNDGIFSWLIDKNQLYNGYWLIDKFNPTLFFISLVLNALLFFILEIQRWLLFLWMLNSNPPLLFTA